MVPKMTFGSGPLVPQKFKGLQKGRQKLSLLTLRVHNRNRESLNMSRKLLFQGMMYLDRVKKYVSSRLAFLLIFAFRSYVKLLRDIA